MSEGEGMPGIIAQQGETVLKKVVWGVVMALEPWLGGLIRLQTASHV